jgi:ribosomal protein L19E
VDVAAQGGETIRDRTVMLSEAAPRAQRAKGRGRQADQGRQAGTQNKQGDRGARQDQGREFETKPLEAARTLEALERGDTDLGQETT